MSSAYASIKRTIPAGGSTEINISGVYVRCIKSSHNSMLIRVDDEPPSVFDQGLSITMQAGKTFEKVTIENTHDTDELEVLLGHGFGILSDDRLSLVGGTLPVSPTAANPPFRVRQETSTAPWVTRDNHTAADPLVVSCFTQVGGPNVGVFTIAATVTHDIVSAAANVNGVILHSLTGAPASNGFIALVNAGGTTLLMKRDTGGDNPRVSNIYLPPGVPLRVYASVETQVHYTYEVVS